MICFPDQDTGIVKYSLNKKLISGYNFVELKIEFRIHLLDILFILHVNTKFQGNNYLIDFILASHRIKIHAIFF